MNVFGYVSFLIFSIFLSTSSTAQQFGGNPASIRWRQINTDTARVIFPAGLEKTAAFISGVIRQVPIATDTTIGSRLRKINIVLQNRTVTSNGYVAMGPYRSEFQLTPLQNSFGLGAIPWDRSLALHEYRHVQQYNNFNRGLSRAVYTILGEQAGALANALVIPDWFFEGDAVYQETLLSEQGRGRVPAFFNDFRALWAAGRNYSWMKWRNGSLRDLVPNHYPLGYLMVAYGRNKFGSSVWKSITSDASAYRKVFYPLQAAFRKHTGESFPEFRTNAMNFFRDRSDKIPTDPVVSVGQSATHFQGDQSFPQWITENEIVYLESSYRRIPAFYSKNLTTGEVNKISTRSISIDDQASVSNGKLVYVSFRPHERWGWREFHEIHVLDLETKKELVLKGENRYFSPDINKNGDEIAVVRLNEQGKAELVLLNATTGAVNKSFPNPGEVYYSYPKFYKNDKLVSLVRNERSEMGLEEIDINSGQSKMLVPFTPTLMGFPSVAGDTIVFTATSNRSDQVFAYWSDSLFQYVGEKATQLTGDYQPSLHGNKLAFTIQTAIGQRLVIDTVKKDSWKFVRNAGIEIAATESNLTTLQTSDPYELNEFASARPLVLNPIDSTTHPVLNYSGAVRFFNFHSIIPYITDPDYSISLVGENILNTTRTEIFFNYNRNEGYKQVGGSFIYSGWFPWLKAGLDYTLDRNALLEGGQRVYWNELQPRVGFEIPLNLTRNKYFRFLEFGSEWVYNKRYLQGSFKDSFDLVPFSYLNSTIGFTNQSQKARMHIYPRFAQSISVNYRNSISQISGRQFLTSAYTYWPGLAQTHNLVLIGAFQQRDSGQAVFSNSFPFSRGYSSENFRRMIRWGASYSFPLVYPDWGFANIVYFLRIRSNCFYDYTIAYSEDFKRSALFRSYGTEIFFDTKWWNQQDISFGIRYSRLQDPDFEGRGANQFEFVLPVNLFSR